jgi:hypothetical protein
MELDFASNPHGSTMLGIDALGDGSTLVSKNSSLVREVTQFFDDVPHGRVFLHYRYATGIYVGLAHNHVIPSFDGKFYLHNGVIENTYNYTVDSFNLVHMADNALDLLDNLLDLGETFANIFIVDPVFGYGVVRLRTGSLFTDSVGNYSTNPIARICEPVERNSANEHDFFEEGHYNVG